MVKSMNFRLTSGQTSDEKNFEKFFIGSKESPSNFRGTLGDSFECLTSSSGRKVRKTPSCLLKDKKDATVKTHWSFEKRTKALSMDRPSFREN